MALTMLLIWHIGTLAITVKLEPNLMLKANHVMCNCPILGIVTDRTLGSAELLAKCSAERSAEPVW